VERFLVSGIDEGNNTTLLLQLPNILGARTSISDAVHRWRNAALCALPEPTSLLLLGTGALG
jgi:hypothetical protein